FYLVYYTYFLLFSLYMLTTPSVTSSLSLHDALPILSDLSGVRSHPAVFVSHLLNVGEEFPDLLHVAVLSVRFGLVVATLLAERLRVNSLCHSQQPSELLGRHGYPLLLRRGHAVTLVHDHRERVMSAPLLQVVRRLGLSLTHRRGEVDRGGVLRLQSDRHTVDAGDPVSDPGNVAEVLRPVLRLAVDRVVLQRLAEVFGLPGLERGAGTLGRVAVAPLGSSLSCHRCAPNSSMPSAGTARPRR